VLEYSGVSSEAYRSGVQNLAAAVCLVTAGRGDQLHGFTATAVMSLSDDPPSLVVGVGSANSSHDLICDSGWFCVNVLADHQLMLADVFAGRGGLRGQERFAEGQWELSRQGPPMLTSALANFVCQLTDRHCYPTHSLIVGHVIELRQAGQGRPLLYWRRSYGGLKE
jgi:flavin reductase (DIM6/NTAB) family NADH-FMN oxidoreductase RutF